MDPGDPVAHWNRGGAAVRRAVGGQRHPGYPRHRRGRLRQPACQAIGEKGITKKAGRLHHLSAFSFTNPKTPINITKVFDFVSFGRAA